MIGRWLGALAIVLGLAAASSSAQPAKRPAVTGISHIAVYSRDLDASDHFYRFILGGVRSPDPEDLHGVRYYFGPQQFVEVLPAPAAQGSSMLAHVAYTTPDAAALRRYFAGSGTTPSELRTGPDGSRWFSLRDPEGNALQFVQPGTFRAKASAAAISSRIIHIGYLVHDRAAEDRFYRSMLGFRPYWFGAMKENAVDWVSQQVPDGHDWLEYMMVGPGSTVPEDHVNARELGVLNHVSLGVPNMEGAVTRLYAENRLSERHDGPSMGRDGKWQANLYDPDGTRVELMEFHAVAKPCCSTFTAADPAP